MLFKYKISNDTANCVFKGSLDTVEITKIEKEVIDSVIAVKTIIFDMEDVEYISSNFLRLCSKVARNNNTSDLSFINVNDDVFKRILLIKI
jgi:anti-anti-sigma regulatory factor